MKKDFPGCSVQELHNAVQNVIRIFDEYSLDKKVLPGNIYRVSSTELRGSFYLIQYFNIENGTQISAKAGKTFGGIGEENARTLVNNLFYRIDQVLTGKIAMTADVANRDVYKSGRGAMGIILLLKLIAAVAAIVIAISVLLHR